MLSAIFQPEISSLESQVAQLQAQIAAAQERITHLSEAESMANGAIQALQITLRQVSALAPDAITNLKAAVLNLFRGDDNKGGNDDGNQPSAPTPNAPTSGIDPGPEPQPNDGISIASAIHEPSPDRYELASWLTCDVLSSQKPDLIDRCWHEMIHQKFTRSELTCLLEDAPLEVLKG